MKRNCHCEEQSDEAIQLDRHVRPCRTRDDRNGIPLRPRRGLGLRSLGVAGFTLLELLVAATVTIVLAGFIFVIVKNVGLTWTRTSGRLGADAQARVVLDQLELDLQGALFRDDNNAWFFATVIDNITNSGNLWSEAARNPKPSGTGANSSLNLTAASIADARFGKAGVWLRFFTTKRGTNDATSAATSASTASAPVAVGYQIIRRFTATNLANTNTAYLLHRAEARPAAVSGRPGVLESGYDISSAPYTTSTTSTNNGATTGDPRSIQVPGSNTGTRNLDSVLADNVIDFGIRCYVRDGNGGLRLIFPADATGKLAGGANTRLRSTMPSSTPAAVLISANAQLFPDVVDVMIRVLTDDGAALIANMEKSQAPALAVPLKYNNNAQAWWWGVAQENSRVYTRRIVLHVQPL